MGKYNIIYIVIGALHSFVEFEQFPFSLLKRNVFNPTHFISINCFNRLLYCSRNNRLLGFEQVA